MKPPTLKKLLHSAERRGAERMRKQFVELCDQWAESAEEERKVHLEHQNERAADVCTVRARIARVFSNSAAALPLDTEQDT